jgi:hypothetical protein
MNVLLYIIATWAGAAIALTQHMITNGALPARTP